MNFRQKIAFSVLLTFVLGSAAFAQLVHMPDPNLRAAVREALDITDRPEVELDAPILRRHLRGLDAGDRGISDLTGLEHATSLTSLLLHNNDISDLRPLAPLVNLTFVRLHGNQINDISPLADLTKLTTLLLDSNSITDLSPLANLTQLTTLGLGNNNITDVSPLANLIQLPILYLKNNNITDISPLANLVNLERLELQNNRITDITPLENLTYLEHLDTHNNPIFDANIPVVDIPDPNLRTAIRETLKLPHGVPVTRAAMRQLTGLGATNSRIIDLTGLEFATSLASLLLHNNDISDLRPLTDLVNLTFIRLHGNQIKDVSPLANLTELTTLLLDSNNIADVSPLANLTQLATLGLGRNNIIDISPLANLTQLTTLELGINNITDISFLANLTHLTALGLGGNNIADVSPLANLINLEWLELEDNQIDDHSPVENLSLIHFIYDEICEMPPLPLQPRLQNRSYPSVVSAWGDVERPPVLNRSELSGIEIMAAHDLWFSNHKYGLDFRETSQGIKIVATASEIDAAIEARNRFHAINPNMIYLVSLNIRSASLRDYPEDWYWLRDAQGELVEVHPGTESYFIDFTLPGFQDEFVELAAALAECGLYDGIFIDWWADDGTLLVTRNPYTVYRGLEAELKAKISIMERIRAITHPDFLILVNTNDRILSRTGSFINGGYMESAFPHTHTGDELEVRLNRAETALTWLEANMRQPRINVLAGGTNTNLAPDAPYNLRWTRTVTTLSLTHSDGYVEYNIGHHEPIGYWYDFWDADLGRPVGPKSQLYDEGIPGLYIREFTNGWAVYNHSGEMQVITLPEAAQGVASGHMNTEHELPNLDGEMYLRAKPRNPADVNGDGVVNIFDLTLVAQAMGTDKPEADVNGDGVVNVFDLVFVANQF